MKSLPILALAAVSALYAVDFDRDIQPLLTAKCLGCHNEKLQTAGLVLESREKMLQGGGPRRGDRPRRARRESVTARRSP